MKRVLQRWGFLLMLGMIVAAGGFGCASTESENRAERPWNAPKDWEHGLPPSLTEGR